MKNPVSRRNFLKFGIGTVGIFAASRSLSQVCDNPTAEQPLGPFFPRAGTPEVRVREDMNPRTALHLANDNDLTVIRGRPGAAKGEVVYVTGKITDKSCNPVPNATIVVWQASESGRYNHRGDADNHDFRHPKTGVMIKRTLDHSFQYWGRTLTNQIGEYRFKTIVPGFYPADLGNQWYRPPHIHFLVTATGFPQLVTQMYFKSDWFANNAWIQELNKKDLLLQSPSITNEQREKLVVDFKEDPTGILTDGLHGEFNIML